MVDIDVKLKAKNRSGEQTLWLQEDDGDYYFTLVGKYNGENIQIDFDTLSREKIEEIHLAIGLPLTFEFRGDRQVYRLASLAMMGWPAPCRQHRLLRKEAT